MTKIAKRDGWRRRAACVTSSASSRPSLPSSRPPSLPWVVGLLLLGLPATASAQEVVFEAQLSADAVPLDGTVQLTVQTIVPRDTRRGRYVPPDLHEFDVDSSPVQQSTQWSSDAKKGQTIRDVETRTYQLRPKRRGLLRIGEAKISIAGQEYQTRPLTVRVGAPGSGGAETAAAARDGGVPPPARGELFLRATLDRPRVYEGEQVNATFSLYTKSDILKYRTIAEPKADGFWSEELYSPQQRLSYERRQVGGQEYSVAVLLKRALFPLQAGKLQIGSMESEVTTFTTAFYSAEGTILKSEPLTLEVRPLPAANRPEGFVVQNVGKFALQANLDRDKIAGGEAATLTVVVRGEGNLRGLKIKTPAVEGLRVYEPKVAERLDAGDVVGGTKTYEFVLLPQKGGTLEIPAIELPYFDPKKERYEVARTAPLKLAVTGVVTATPGPGGGSATGAGVENVLQPEVRTIRARKSISSRVGATLYREQAFRVLLAVPIFLYVFVVLFERVRAFLKRETRRALMRKAKWRARSRFRAAETHVKLNRAPQFFSEIERALREYVGAQLGVNLGGFTLSELREHLEQRGYPSETAGEVVSQLEMCDFARFAQAAPGAGEMRATAKKARELLDRVERVRVREA